LGIVLSGGSPHALSTGVFLRFSIKPYNHTQPTTPGSFYLSALVALAPSLLWWGEMRGSALVALLPCWCGGGIELWSCRATVFVMGRM